MLSSLYAYFNSMNINRVITSTNKGIETYSATNMIHILATRISLEYYVLKGWFGIKAAETKPTAARCM
jgi:hypothetical membrane protein